MPMRLIESTCLALPCLALPCLALPCRALPCLAVPCRALPCRALPWRSASHREGTDTPRLVCREMVQSGRSVKHEPAGTTHDAFHTWRRSNPRPLGRGRCRTEQTSLGESRRIAAKLQMARSSTSAREHDGWPAAASFYAHPHPLSRTFSGDAECASGWSKFSASFGACGDTVLREARARRHGNQ
ncbi:hypothetical protein OKW33_006353 [Paraburkholderia atlantica]